MLNRNRAGAVILAASIAFTSFATGCKPKKKNNEKLIKKCTSKVDDYMMYLTKGKIEKLSKYIDPEECRRLVDEAPEDKVVIGMAWCCHFQDACAAFGMQAYLMNMLAEPEMCHYVDDHIERFGRI